MNKIMLTVSVLVLAMLACGEYITPTPTRVVATVSVISSITPRPTSTALATLTETPTAQSLAQYLCVTASETVYLRTQPDMAHDAIVSLANGTRVIDTGTHDGDWIFVEYGDKAGWIHSAYLAECQ